jgi:hypothetical protein
MSEQRTRDQEPKRDKTVQAHRADCAPGGICHRGLDVTGIRTCAATADFAPARPTCGIFATLGKFFVPVTLLGGFPVRMSRIYNRAGAVKHEHRYVAGDFDPDVRDRRRSAPVGSATTPVGGAVNDEADRSAGAGRDRKHALQRGRPRNAPALEQGPAAPWKALQQAIAAFRSGGRPRRGTTMILKKPGRPGKVG